MQVFLQTLFDASQHQSIREGDGKARDITLVAFGAGPGVVTLLTGMPDDPRYVVDLKQKVDFKDGLVEARTMDAKTVTIGFGVRRPLVTQDLAYHV